MLRKLCAIAAITAILFGALPAGPPAAGDVVINSYVFGSGGGGGGGGGGCCATEFDGSTQYEKHTDNTSWSDSNLCTMSVWFKRADSGATEHLFSITQTQPMFDVYFDSSDKLNLRGLDGIITTRLSAVTTTATYTDTNWHHLLFSFDLTNSAKRWVYVDDSAVTMTWTTYSGASSIRFAPTSGYQYDVASKSAGSESFNGDLSELWLDLSEIDLSISSNRRKWITAGGLPEDVGADGSTPTGSAPTLYMSDVSGTNDAGTTSNFTPIGSPTSVAGPNP